MIQLLADNPLLLLFLVAASGYLIGRIKIAGSSLGVAAVLFVGLGVGALDARLRLPEILPQLGLALFVYTIGLSSAHAFFNSFKGRGLQQNLLVIFVLCCGAGLIGLAQHWLQIRPTLMVGLFAGSFTNTPALASAIEFVKVNSVGISGVALEQRIADPTIGYSLAYPMGVLGMIFVYGLLRRVWGKSVIQDREQLRALGALNDPLVSLTLRITKQLTPLTTIRSLLQTHHWDAIFVRYSPAQQKNLSGLDTPAPVALVEEDTALHVGDLLTAVGRAEVLDAVVAELGEVSPDAIDLDRSEIDFERVFVSNPDLVARPLSELDLRGRFGALMTRVRRGDNTFVPRSDTVLQMGDRVRIVAPRQLIGAVKAFFGDSYRAVSELDVLTFNLGLALGLLAGIVAIPLSTSGGLTVKLGVAGGPLLVALCLGRIERTGKLVWTLPYSVNLTLRQAGFVMFLAGIGTRAGQAFVNTLLSSGGFYLFALGALFTCVSAVLFLVLGKALLKLPIDMLGGLLAGMQTQPALLAFATEQAHNDAPELGYSQVVPVAILTKIVLAQVLLLILQ